MKTCTHHSAPAVRAAAGAPMGIAALVAVAGLAMPALAQNMQWTGAVSEAWANPGNWTPWGLPSDLTNVFIGPHPAIENGRVEMSSSLTIASLSISDGMVLDTDWHRLTVEGDTVLTGSNLVPLSENGSILYQSGLDLGAADGSSLTTQYRTLTDGAAVRMKSSFVRINDLMSIGDGTAVRGSGVIDMWDSGTTFRNDGLIQVMHSNGILLRQFGGGEYDLDGVTGGGYIHMGSDDGDTDQGYRFRMDGTALTDSFSGDLVLGPDSDLYANLSEGWTIDASAKVWVAGLSGVSGDPAVIRGGDLELAGDVEVVGIGHLSLQSDTTTILEAARITMNPQSQTTVGSDTGTEVIVEGGTFTLDEDSMMRFRGDTTVRGGSFSTFSDSSADGTVIFEGHTELDGVVGFAGTARFEGDVTVSGPSVINAGVLDMDGTSANTWNINSHLVINADAIDVGVSNVNSNIDIAGGFLSTLTVNLDGSGESWQMQGDLNLTGDLGLFITRVAGSNMVVTGDVSLPSGKAQITAMTTFSGGSTVSLGSAGATLRMRSYTLVGPGTTFLGDGTLQNGPGGDMELFDGVSLDQVGLVNEGRLWVGIGDASVSVDRFANTGDGELVMDIFGTETGFAQDLLMVSSGSAQLDGTLEISVISSKGAAYLPQVGDEFTLIVALGGISGTFSSVPSSFFFGGYELDWTVIYHPHSVVVRLDSIVPTPGSLALVGACGLAAAGRFRRR